MNTAAALAASDASSAVDRRNVRPTDVAGSALRGAAAFWLSLVVVGQFIFAAYVVSFYGRAALLGHPEAWNKVLQTGYVAGDTSGNLALMSHLLLAVIITVGGALQLMPFIRRRWPRFHRWNGRVYLLCVTIGAIGGLWMVWMRKSTGGGDLSQNIGISVNAVLIFSFAGLALRNALARRLDVHRRWAMRLFLCASGGWFFRIGLMFWIVANRGPVGFDPKTFTGPFLTFLSFAQYLVPLAVLQLYFIAQQSRSAVLRSATAATLVLLTLMMGAGIAAATAIMWLPHF